MTLQTTDALPGLTDAATFYAQEAKKAGVTVNVKTVPGSSYFNPSLLFLKMPFAQDSWPIVSLSHAYHLLGVLDRAGQRGPLDEPDVRRAGAGGRVDPLAVQVEGLVDAGAADVLAGLELHRLGPPPLDERHRAEPERRAARLAVPARGHEGLGLVVLVGALSGWGAGSCNPAGLQNLTPLLRFFLKRLAIGALTLLVASMLIFAATDLLPGSPASNALGKFATPEETRALNQKLGYDHPLPVRYWNWLSGAVQGDLGASAVGTANAGVKAPIWPLIHDRLLNTLTLALISALLLVPLALFFGTWAALRAGRVTDHTISTGCSRRSRCPSSSPGRCSCCSSSRCSAGCSRTR